MQQFTPPTPNEGVPLTNGTSAPDLHESEFPVEEPSTTSTVCDDHIVGSPPTRSSSDNGHTTPQKRHSSSTKRPTLVIPPIQKRRKTGSNTFVPTGEFLDDIVDSSIQGLMKMKDDEVSVDELAICLQECSVDPTTCL